MSEHSTPGQVAYTAYMAVLALSFPMDFAALPDTYRRAWEAAAQAVRDLRDFPPLDLSVREEDSACP